MADLDGAPRPFADLDALPHRVYDRLAFSPDMARIESLMPRDPSRELDNLVCARETARRIDETRTHPERAGTHRLVDMLPHPVQLGGCGRAFVETHHCEADRSMPDEPCDVDPDASSLHEIEVLLIRGPSPVARSRIVLKAANR